MENYIEFLNSVRIINGLGSLSMLSGAMKQCKITNPFVVTGPNLFKLGIIDKIKAANPSVEIKHVFSKIPTDSLFSVVEELAKKIKESGADGIVAIGGGSVLDTAKAAKLMVSQGADKLECLAGVDHLSKKEKVPFIAIPTTAGTGSEVTKVAVISDPKREIKMAFLSREMLADVCILDAELTKSLPVTSAVLCAIDAFTHAVEGYTSSQRSEIAVEHAKIALRAIWKNLPTFVEQPDDDEIRQVLLEASCVAGICFSNSMVGLVHAVAHAVGAVSKLSHSQAIAILLPHCMKFNKDVVKKYYAEMLLMLCEKEEYENVEIEDRADKFIEILEAKLQAMEAKFSLSLKLSSLGVKEGQLDEIAKKAMSDGALLTNLKRVTKKDINAILSAAF